MEPLAPLHMERPEANQRARQRLRSRSGVPSSLPPSSSSLDAAAAPIPVKRSRRALRLCFSRWQRVVLHHGETSRLQIAESYAQLRAVKQWARFLRQRRHENEKAALLDAWRVTRACRHWTRWAKRRQQLRALLHADRQSLIGRLRIERVWRRWACFTKRHTCIRAAMERQAERSRHRLALRVWHALRAHAFRRRQERNTLRRCMHQMRNFQELQEHSRLRCFQHQQLLATERKRRLLRRWRTFAYTAGRERRLVCRVQFGMRRRRFFSLWWQAARVKQRTAPFRAKVKQRELSQHFDAWERVTRAIQMGEQVQHVRDQDLRAVYFAALKEQTRLLSRARYAALALDFLRLSRAVREMHVWAVKQRNQRNGAYQLQLKREKRVVRLAWCHGWVPFHCRKQRGKLAVEHGCLALEARLLGVWKRFLKIKRARDDERQCAEVIHCKFCCQRVLAQWKRYLQSRHVHELQLEQGESHYRSRLMQKGVVFLWAKVNQKAQNAARSHHLRYKARTSLKKRQFFRWQELTRQRAILAKKVAKYRRSVAYQASICNPHRRIWIRWKNYIAWARKRQLGEVNYRLRVKRRVLASWHARVTAEYRLRMFARSKRAKTLAALFSRWNRCITHWRKVRAVLELSKRIYERKLCIRVLRGWSHCSSTYLPRLRLCGETLRREQAMKVRFKWFWVWHAQLHVHQRLVRLRGGLEHRQLQYCFANWRQYSTKCSALQRKFTFFQRIHGKHPLSSPVRCFWRQWTTFANNSSQAKQLRRRCLRRLVGPYWARWIRFHTCYQHFHSLRRATMEMSNSNNKLRTRLRHFRESQRHSRQSGVIQRWKALVRRRRELHERQLVLKNQANREFETQFKYLEQATHFRLKHWIRRWQTAQSKTSALPREHFAFRLLRKVLVSWWRATIHAKQERVLAEAQHAIGNLSFYHPHQRQHVATAQRHRRTNKLSVRKRVMLAEESSRREELRRMRRMLDPAEQRNYSAWHQRQQDSDVHGVDHVYRVSRSHPQVSDDVLSRTKGDQRDGVSGVVAHTLPVSRPSLRQVAETTMVTGHRASSDSHEMNAPVHLKTTINAEYLGEQPKANNRNRLPSRLSEMVENVLPLFDADIRSSPDRQLQQHTPEKVTTTEKTQKHEFPTVMPLERGRQAKHQPELARYNKEPRRDPVLTMETPRSHQETPSISSTTTLAAVHRADCRAMTQRPIELDSTKSLMKAQSVNEIHGNRGSIRSKARSGACKRKQVPKVLQVASDVDRGLADILEIPRGNQADCTRRQEVPTANSVVAEKQAVFDDSVIDEVLGFYMDALVNGIKANDTTDRIESLAGRRKRVCFRMVRDLALFQNDFYINELDKIYKDSFRYATTGSSECVHPADRLEERDRLELFLGQIVEAHPKYLDYRTRGHRGVDTLSSLPLDPLTWLVRCHLRPVTPTLKRRTDLSSIQKTRWIGDPLPSDMERALEKLLLVIKKYMRVLGQFFMRQTVQRTSKRDSAQSHRMNSTAFVSLMKQVQVFPQLFHRRELEEAVEMSCRSSHGAANLNFPEFVEALVRCSCNLRWGDVDNNRFDRGEQGESTVVVIKFLMLVFAMEGNGSVLQKRSDDLDVILGFLGRQKQQNKSEKLFRFHHMLAEDKRKRQSQKATRRRNASFWSHIRLRLTQPKSPSLQSHDTFEELTHSWGRNSHCDEDSLGLEPVVFNAQTDEPFGVELYSPSGSSASVDTGSGLELQTAPLPGPREDARTYISDMANSTDGTPVEADGTQSRPAYPSALGPDQTGTVDSSHSGDAPHAPDSQEISSQPALSDLREASPVGRDASEPRDEQTAFQSEVAGAVVSGSTANRGEIGGKCGVERDMATSALPPGLGKPMEKEEFLQDILSSIGDVELLLHQTKPNGRNRPRSALREDCTRTVDTASPLWEMSPKLDAVTADCTLHDISSGSWEASSHTWSTGEDQLHAEISVRDPMLNYLTDIDRFTESADNKSLSAIAEMSEYPFIPDSAGSATDVSDIPPSPDTPNSLQ